MRYFNVTVLATIVNLSYVVLATAPVQHGPQQLVFTDHSPTASTIRNSLQKAEVIPDVLDDFTPLFSLNLSFPKSHASVHLGNKIKPSDVSSSPDVYVHAVGAKDDSYPTPTIRNNTTYTLVLTDPDATSRSDPKMAEMCHWIVTDITLGEDSVDHVVHLPREFNAMTAGSLPEQLGSQDIINDGKPSELMSYYPPAPPPKTGYHRYVFVLLAPKADANDVRGTAGLKKPKARPHWGYDKIGKGVRDWAADNGLTAVGADFFYAKNKKQ
ncbi:MAG: hypothetical protein Q9186_001015 [Xanthomendoza sp. 1 TL-2023]